MEKRFEFGRNWRSFVDTVDETRIEAAVQGVRTLVRRPDMAGLRFLDIGCGSGLSSLAACRLGARVVGFDYDADSVIASERLRARFAPDGAAWRIERGSALDDAYLQSLGQFDVVYSWGVLHHTGDMARALELAASRVAPGGLLALAIYNDQGRSSRAWARIKRAYVQGGRPARAALLALGTLRLWGPTAARDLLAHADPTRSWRAYRRDRGMSPWHDVVDWIGGWPFEVATPELIFEIHRARGFELRGLKTSAGGIGCNEFLFRAPA
jgi:SAM-dependent methyltransferase